MQLLGDKHNLFRFHKAHAFYYLAAISAMVVVVAFLLLIGTLIYRAAPILQSPSYEQHILDVDNDAIHQLVGVTQDKAAQLTVWGHQLLPQKTYITSASEQAKLAQQCELRSFTVALPEHSLSEYTPPQKWGVVPCDMSYEWLDTPTGTLQLGYSQGQLYAFRQYEQPMRIELPADFTLHAITYLHGRGILLTGHSLADVGAGTGTGTAQETRVQRYLYQPNQGVLTELSIAAPLLVLHPMQPLAMGYDGEYLTLFSDQMLIQRKALQDVEAIYPSRIPATFYILTKSGEERVLARVSWQQQKPLQITPIMTLGRMDRVIAILESDMHNVLQVAVHRQGQTHLQLLNSVTFQPLATTALNAELTLVDTQRDSLTWLDGKQLIWLHLKQLNASVTLRELFEAHQYPGYDEPSHTWQTNPALDYIPKKYSVVPLLIGSLKASLLALMIAMPLALGSAIYVGFFAQSQVRAWVKPIIETLESIPSVIIGLIAATVLLAMANELVLAIAAIILLLPVFLVICGYTYRALQRIGWQQRFVRFEVWIMSLGLALYIALCVSVLGPWLAQLEWLSGLQNTNKVTFIVAIALGIGVAPTVFSLAEDAIHGVPNAMVKAAYALGASRVQTLKGVVLFTAFPGIMAAMMLGFGRAFGETMIVLMVTGNSPVSDWSLFSGLRALTANLVIEIPEMNSENSHMAVLFFTAFLLFTFTFVLNSFAEFLRHLNRKVRGELYDE